MKRQNITLTTFFLLSFCVKVAAQSFNTISGSRPRYRVEQVPVYEEKEASPESDTSYVDSMEPADTTTMPLPKETKRTRYPLSVSYPLRQKKLIITSPFGWRRHPVLGSRRFHAGVDLRANFEIVYAMLPGEVLNTGYESKGGNYISLRHGSIKVTYCHLSHIAVKKGDAVFAGQPIGVSGNSGQYTTGAHLHLGVKDMRTNQPIAANLLLEYLTRHILPYHPI